MKRILLSVSMALLSLVAIAQEGTWVEVNETNFPDENFRAIIKAHPVYYNAETNQIRTDLITRFTANASAMYPYYGGKLDGKEIEDLTGIRFFTNLEQLSCTDNKLASLDVSGLTGITWLTCYLNRLTSLEMTGLTNLSYLYCQSNKLTSLDLSNKEKLNSIQCQFNNLTELNLSDNIELTELICHGNGIATLDLSKNMKLVSVWCGDQTTAIEGGSKMSSLVLPNTSTLKEVQCHDNNLSAEVLNTALALSNVRLKTLSCGNNPLSPTIDLSSQTELETLMCYNCGLSSLTVNSPVLETLRCNNDPRYNDTPENTLTNTTLDISAVSNESLTSLWMSNLPGIKDLTVNNINTGRFVNLQTLKCDNCDLSELDVSTNTKLTALSCEKNKLTKLDLSANNLLSSELKVGNNRLRCIDFSSHGKFPKKPLVIMEKDQRFYDNLVVLGTERNKLGLYLSDVSDGITQAADRFWVSSYPSGANKVSLVYKDVPVSEIIEQDGKQYLVLHTQTGTTASIPASPFLRAICFKALRRILRLVRRQSWCWGVSR